MDLGEFRVFEVGDWGMVDARVEIPSILGSFASRVVIAGCEVVGRGSRTLWWRRTGSNHRF